MHALLSQIYKLGNLKLYAFKHSYTTALNNSSFIAFHLSLHVQFDVSGIASWIL